MRETNAFLFVPTNRCVFLPNGSQCRRVCHARRVTPCVGFVRLPEVVFVIVVFVNDGFDALSW